MEQEITARNQAQRCEVGQLDSFEAKIREAISLVRSMTTEDKLKAVQYWNAVSENLQDIVNSSANDISALASQLSERESLIAREQVKLPRPHVPIHSSGLSQSSAHFLSSPEILPQLSVSQNVKVLSQSHMENTSTLFHLEEKQSDNSMLSTDLLDQYLTGPQSVVASGNEGQGQACLPVMVDSCDAFSPNVRIEDQVHSSSALDPLESVNNSELHSRINRNSDSSSHRIIVEEQFQPGSPHDLGDDDDPLPLTDIHLSDADTRDLEVDDMDVPIHAASNANSSQSIELTVEEKCKLGNLDDLEKYLTVARNRKGVPVLNFFTKQSVESEMEGDNRFEYVCNLCKKSFHLIRHFYLHFSEHTKPVICSFCGISFSSKGECKKHIDEHHNVAERLVQNIHSENFSQNNDSKSTAKCITSENLGSPSFTGIKTKDGPTKQIQRGIVEHAVKNVVMEKPMKRTMTVTNQVTKAKTDEDMLVLNSLPPSNDCNRNGSRQCKLCGRQCSTASNLTRHMRTHTGDRPFQCSACGKQFREKKSLQTHERLHSGERPYQCTVCLSSFLQLSNLNEHKEMHSSTKRHLCEVCGKSFRQPAQLKAHMSRHEGRKAHRCDKCPMAFNVLNDLKRHRHSHLDEKPFKCSQCSKSFARQQALAEHMNRHFGTKPYQCPLCAKCYADLSACHKHIKRAHKNKPKPSSKTGSTLSELDDPVTGEALFVVSDVTV